MLQPHLEPEAALKLLAAAKPLAAAMAGSEVVPGSAASANDMLIASYLGKRAAAEAGSSSGASAAVDVAAVARAVMPFPMCLQPPAAWATGDPLPPGQLRLVVLCKADLDRAQRAGVLLGCGLSFQLTVKSAGLPHEEWGTACKGRFPRDYYLALLAVSPAQTERVRLPAGVLPKLKVACSLPLAHRAAAAAAAGAGVGAAAAPRPVNWVLRPAYGPGYVLDKPLVLHLKRASRAQAARSVTVVGMASKVAQLTAALTRAAVKSVGVSLVAACRDSAARADQASHAAAIAAFAAQANAKLSDSSSAGFAAPEGLSALARPAAATSSASAGAGAQAESGEEAGTGSAAAAATSGRARRAARKAADADFERHAFGAIPGTAADLGAVRKAILGDGHDLKTGSDLDDLRRGQGELSEPVVNEDGLARVLFPSMRGLGISAAAPDGISDGAADSAGAPAAASTAAGAGAGTGLGAARAVGAAGAVASGRAAPASAHAAADSSAPTGARARAGAGAGTSAAMAAAEDDDDDDEFDDSGSDSERSFKPSRSDFDDSDSSGSDDGAGIM